MEFCVEKRGDQNPPTKKLEFAHL